MSSSLGKYNAAISEQYKFIQNYKPTAAGIAPKSTTDTSDTSSTTGTTPTTTTSTSDTLNQTMAYMLMMMMMKFMGGGTATGTTGAGDVTGNTTNTPNTSMTALMNQALASYIPSLTASTTTSAADVATAMQSNPAVKFMDALFKTNANTDGTTDTAVTADNVTALKDAVDAGQVTPTQLGQAMMYELDTTDPANLSAVSDLMSGMVNSGDLNLAPFLQSGYLDGLSDAQKAALGTTLTNTGLTLDDGSTNNRFAVSLLDGLSKTADDSTKDFVESFLQSQYTALKAGTSTNTASAAILDNILALSSTTVDSTGKLVFKYPLTTDTSSTTNTANTTDDTDDSDTSV